MVSSCLRHAEILRPRGFSQPIGVLTIIRPDDVLVVGGVAHASLNMLVV